MKTLYEKYSLLTKLAKLALNIALKLTLVSSCFSLRSGCISDLLDTFNAFLRATVFHPDDSREELLSSFNACFAQLWRNRVILIQRLIIVAVMNS